MPSTNVLTHSQTPPRRPTVDDLGGGQKVNGLAKPDPARHFCAEDANQSAKQIAALGRVAPLAVLKVDYSGSYVKAGLSCQADEGVSLSAFTVYRVSAGVVEITWNPARFPTPVRRPTVQVIGTTPLLHAIELYTDSGDSGARLRFLTHTGVATDTAFDFELF